MLQFPDLRYIDFKQMKVAPSRESNKFFPIRRIERTAEMMKSDELLNEDNSKSEAEKKKELKSIQSEIEALKNEIDELSKEEKEQINKIKLKYSCLYDLKTKSRLII